MSAPSVILIFNAGQGMLMMAKLLYPIRMQNLRKCENGALRVNPAHGEPKLAAGAVLAKNTG